LQIASLFVRPFVKSKKTNFGDAEVICDAVPRPSMRFVMVKTPKPHRLCDGLVAERTATKNQVQVF
jgi:transposase